MLCMFYLFIIIFTYFSLCNVVVMVCVCVCVDAMSLRDEMGCGL